MKDVVFDYKNALDFISIDEIKAAEKKYLRVVESFKQYGRDQK